MVWRRILQGIIEHIVDGRLGVIMQKNLLQPLGMQNNFHSPVFPLIIHSSTNVRLRSRQPVFVDESEAIVPSRSSGAASKSRQPCGGGGPMSRDFKFTIVLTICLIWIAIAGYIAGVPW